MTNYSDLGARRIINAEAFRTYIGGSLLPQEVLEAMAQASSMHVYIVDLQDRIGKRLAALTRNEAAFPVSGAAAGLVIATLACRTGPDLAAITGLPHGPSRDEVIIHSSHRIPYDRAVDVAGARLITVGNAFTTHDHELEAAISHRTAMVLYVAGAHLSRAALSLETTVEIAHARGIPVVVDAAAQLPPPSNLWGFTVEKRADLAVFSGGKALRGPQSSGLIVGTSRLIAACAANAPPHQRYARAMKTGKEEMMGLLAAVERFLLLDHDLLSKEYERIVGEWIARFQGIPGVTATRAFPNEAGQPVPRLRLELDPTVIGVSGRDLHRALWEVDPIVAVEPDGDLAVFATPDTLDFGEEEVVVDSILKVLGRGR